GAREVARAAGARRPALAVDPAREVRGTRHVGRQREDVIAHGEAAEVAENPSEGFLARRWRRIALLQAIGYLRLRAVEGGCGEGCGAARDQARLCARLRKCLPLLPRLHPQRLAESVELRRAEQRAVIH